VASFSYSSFWQKLAPLRIAPQQAYRGFTLKTPIWEPYIYLRSSVPPCVTPFGM
jgi:hypothetical protein